MGICTLQEIKQIDRLRDRIKAPVVCADDGTDGKIHYIIGYCQGLFNQDKNTPEEHTNVLCDNFKNLKAPMPTSHELFIDLKPEYMTISEYVKRASAPLKDDGRVPIIITMYDAAHNMPEINEILSTESPFSDKHTILFRIQLGSKNSINATASLVKELYKASLESKKIPTYWPLIQADNFPMTEWQDFRSTVGEEIWPYITIATSPFMNKNTLESLVENIAVIQLFVGEADKIKDDGTITVPIKSCVGSGNYEVKYNAIDYAESLNNTSGLNAVIGIVCGQSQNWTQEENFKRLEKYLPFLKKTIQIVWKREMGERTSKPYFNKIKPPQEHTIMS